MINSINNFYTKWKRKVGLPIEIVIIKVLFYFNRLFYKKKYKEKSIMILIPQLRNGGAERVVSNISEELAKKYKVILVTISDKTEEDYNCNVNRIVIGIGKNKLFKRLYYINKIRNIKKKYQITHSISFASKMNFYNTFSKASDITIISIRNYLSASEREIQYRYINRQSGKFSDKIVTVSNILKTEQIEKYNAKENKITTIYNFCDEKKIDDMLSKDNEFEKNDENMIINVGRLTYQKGQVHLIKAFRDVVKEIPDAKLFILGQGELKEQLIEEINKNGLQKNVLLMGFQKNPYVYLAKAKAFVSSSYFEGMSNAILEAMYCNLPIISTDCKAGTREIIAPDTDIYKENVEMTYEKYGILVPVIKEEKNIKELSKAIIEILKNNELRLHYKNKSKERIKDFSKEKIIKQWIDLINYE